jgi:hypothetical protein
MGISAKLEKREVTGGLFVDDEIVKGTFDLNNDITALYAYPARRLRGI